MVTGRCWYCAHDGVALTDEHVLSKSNFGGRLVASKAICVRCNSKAGELEDQLARSAGVAELVGRYGTTINARRPPRPQTDGIYVDRAEVTVQYGANGLSIRDFKPRRVGTDPDGTQVWEVAQGREAQFVERRRRRGEKVRAIGRQLAVQPGMNVKYGLGLHNFDVWPRIGAKVALSLASIVFAPNWIDTRGARALQYGFHQGRWDSRYYPHGALWQPTELPASDDVAMLLQPGEHLVGLDHDEGGRVWMIVFGRLAYELRVHDAPIPPEGYAWLLRPEGSQQQDPLADAVLLTQLRQRASQTVGE